MNDPKIITVRDCRAYGYCLLPGSREFARRHGLDWREFVRNGIPVETLLGTGDAMARHIVAAKYGDLTEEGGDG